jgi:hypothetical protein
MTKLIVAFRNFAKAPKKQRVNYLQGNHIYIYTRVCVFVV